MTRTEARNVNAFNIKKELVKRRYGKHVQVTTDPNEDFSGVLATPRLGRIAGAKAILGESLPVIQLMCKNMDNEDEDPKSNIGTDPEAMDYDKALYLFSKELHGSAVQADEEDSEKYPVVIAPKVKTRVKINKKADMPGMPEESEAPAASDDAARRAVHASTNAFYNLVRDVIA